MPRRFHASLVVILLPVPDLLCRAVILPRATSLSTRDVDIPSCSQDCLSSFISSNFPSSVCTNQRDLSCLCSKRSKSGFTLGEAALRCVLSSCPDPGNSDLDVYGICSGIPSALPNTHTALTATATVMETGSGRATKTFPATLTLVPASTSLSTSPPRTTTSSITTLTTSKAAQTPSLTTSLPSSTVSTSTQTSQVPSEPAAAASPPPLTNGQVIGISVAGAVGGAFIFAIIIFFIVRRRRRRILERRESEFEIGGNMTEPPPDSPSGYPGKPAVKTPVGTYNEPIGRRLTLAANARQTAAAAGLPYPGYRQNEGDDLSLTTPRAVKTPRRLSQLLPEKPDYGVSLSQHPITDRLGRRPPSSATIFEEDIDDRKTRLPERGGLPSQPNNGYRPTVPYQPGRPQYGQYPPFPNPRQPPNLRLITPTRNGYQNRPNMPIPPQRQFQRQEFGSSIRAIRPISSEYSSFYSQDGPGRNRAPDQSTQYRRRASDRTSGASITSFESMTSDEASADPKRATMRLSRLSPVKEGLSPDPNDSNSKSKPLRYPVKIARTDSSSPTSSNLPRQYPARNAPPPTTATAAQQANRTLRPAISFSSPNYERPYINNSTEQLPPNSTVSNSSNNSANSLLAKRRGEDVAGKLESSFKGPSNLRSERKDGQPSPLRIRGKGNGNAETDTSGAAGEVRVGVGSRAGWGFKTPSPKFSQREGEQSDGGESDGGGGGGGTFGRGRKVTPTRRGPDLYLNVH
ncbi:hypothetical protein FQN52_005493 [Onygenales sp. PD_12]|nr:hypothetical protein FQN52_005493 [Onygenales sp. PD_12]